MALYGTSTRFSIKYSPTILLASEYMRLTRLGRYSLRDSTFGRLRLAIKYPAPPAIPPAMNRNTRKSAMVFKFNFCLRFIRKIHFCHPRMSLSGIWFKTRFPIKNFGNDILVVVCEPPGLMTVHPKVPYLIHPTDCSLLSSTHCSLLIASYATIFLSNILYPIASDTSCGAICSLESRSAMVRATFSILLYPRTLRPSLSMACSIRLSDSLLILQYLPI